jgi:solute carrier family 8 (sodium/calcium exchanger)
MCAIEKITSKTQTIKIASTDTESGIEEVKIKVWNNTVANLTLMALGSSAPEILLSVVGVVGNNMLSDELGPSTIVGSAAFNLLVITAVCIMAIPSPEIRRIKEFKVFAITAFFSVFAYIWLLIILVGITPDYVDLWEAIVTFLMFPFLVILAYLADKNFFRKKKPRSEDIPIGFGKFYD